MFIISSEEVTKLHIYKAINEGKARVPSRSSFYSEAGVALNVQRRVITSLPSAYSFPNPNIQHEKWGDPVKIFFLEFRVWQHSPLGTAYWSMLYFASLCEKTESVPGID